MTASGVLSLRALSRLMGVSEKAIRKAMAVGVFSEAAIRRDADGVPTVVDATAAVAEWQKSGRQLRGSPRRQPPAPSSSIAADAGSTIQPPASNTAPRDTTEIDALLARVRELRLRQQPALAASDDDPDLPAEDDPATKDPTLLDAQRVAMVERGRKLRMENDEREGLLIEASRASRQAFEFARALRENVMNIPSRLAAELAAEPDQARVYARLDGALREALEATAGKLEATAVNE